MSKSYGFNQSILKGGLVKDPELRHTNNNIAFLSFSLACPCRTMKNGQWEDGVDYVPCKAWGSSAELIGKYCEKGTQLFIVGKTKTDSYKDKDGKTVWNTYTLVSTVQFAGGRRKDEARQPEPSNINPVMGFDFSDGPQDMGMTADVPF